MEQKDADRGGFECKRWDHHSALRLHASKSLRSRTTHNNANNVILSTSRKSPMQPGHMARPLGLGTGSGTTQRGTAEGGGTGETSKVPTNHNLSAFPLDQSCSGFIQPTSSPSQEPGKQMDLGTAGNGCGKGRKSLLALCRGRSARGGRISSCINPPLPHPNPPFSLPAHSYYSRVDT